MAAVYMTTHLVRAILCERNIAMKKCKLSCSCLLLGLTLLIGLSCACGGSSEGDTTADTSLETVAGTIPETTDETTSEIVSETAPRTEPESGFENESDPETSTETETRSETETETEPETEPETMPSVSDRSIGIANVAHTGFAMASSSRYTEGKYANIYVNDRDSTTAFSTNLLETADTETYLFIDLTRAWSIRQVILTPEAGEEQLFPVSFDLQVSQDGQEWTTVESFTGVTGIGEAGFTMEVDRTARYVRVLIHELAADSKGTGYRCIIDEMQVLADVSRLDDLVLRQDDMWIYMDSHASLVVDHVLIDGSEGGETLRFYSDDPTVATVDAEGNITPVGYGDTTLYVYDGANLSACHVRVLDDSRTEFRISTFYHSTFGYPDVIPACLDYMKEAGITFLEETRAFDAVGNVVCDYMMYLCAERDIFYSVCDLINSSALLDLKDKEIIELVQKYEHRAGFGGIYLVDEPHEESNDYAHIVNVINEYAPHITAHLNMLPIGGFPSWEEYISDYCAVAGTPGRWRYLSYDNYCFLAGGGFNWGVFNSLNRIRKYGLMYNANTGYYMQCMEISGAYRVSSDEELLFNASMGLAYGMKNFKWFVYLTPITSGEAYKTGMIGPDFTPSVMYEGVKAANAKIAEWGKILGRSDAIEVYHTSEVNGNEVVPEDFVLYQMTENDAIYTLYRSNEDGRQYLVVVNRDWGKDRDKEFTFAIPEELMSLDLYENGGWTSLDLSDGTFTLFIEAGDSAILRLPEDYDARRPAEEKSEDLALGRPVYVSSSQYTFWQDTPRGALYLTDGDTTSNGWIADKQDKRPVLTVDLGETYDIAEVHLYQFLRLPKTAKVEVSTDGVTWTEVAAYDELTYVDGKCVLSFDSVAARYVRLSLTSTQCSVGEIEIYA